MYVYVYICIHAYTCIHIYTHIHTCRCIYTHTYTYIHVYTHTHCCCLASQRSGGLWNGGAGRAFLGQGRLHTNTESKHSSMFMSVYVFFLLFCYLYCLRLLVI